MKGLRVLLMTGLLVAGVIRGMGQSGTTQIGCRPDQNCVKIGPVMTFPAANSQSITLPEGRMHPGDCFKLSPSMTLEKIKCPKLTNPTAKKDRPIWADGSPRIEPVSGPVPEAPLDPIGIILANEPIDVPAIQEERLIHRAGDTCEGVTMMACVYTEDVYGPHWTCADKSRVLETAEDGKHWCRKIQN